MTTDMHLTYLITPVDLSAWDRRGPDWSCLYQLLHSLQVGPCYTDCQAANCCFDRVGCTSKLTPILLQTAVLLANVCLDRSGCDKMYCGCNPQGTSVHTHCVEVPEQRVWLPHAYMACLGIHHTNNPPPPIPLHPSLHRPLTATLLQNPQRSFLVPQKADRKVAERVGVNQAHLLKLVQSGQRRNMSEADLEKERICMRFFMALMLNDVIQEVCMEDTISALGHSCVSLLCFDFCLANLMHSPAARTLR